MSRDFAAALLNYSKESGEPLPEGAVVDEVHDNLDLAVKDLEDAAGELREVSDTVENIVDSSVSLEALAADIDTVIAKGKGYNYDGLRMIQRNLNVCLESAKLPEQFLSEYRNVIVRLNDGGYTQEAEENVEKDKPGYASRAGAAVKSAASKIWEMIK